MPDPPSIGIYVHPRGGGHAARGGAIGSALRDRGASVTYLSSLPPDRIGPGEHLELPPVEPMAAIAGWIERARPDLLLVDASVEVAMVASVSRVPFAYLRQAGERDDRAHDLAYRFAAGLLAPYEERLEPASTPAEHRAKTVYVGAVTRFDGRPRPRAKGRPRRAIVLGEAGVALHATIAAAARGWQVLGPREVDLELLSQCLVVVAPGGANSVAEAAFARCGLVCVPRTRPSGEHFARGRELAREGAAVVLDDPPAPERWPLLLEEARFRRDALAGWADGGGAGRAADHLLGLAAGARPSRPDDFVAGEAGYRS
jgi:hypothetical protein